MTALLTFTTLALYLGVLFVLTHKSNRTADNDTFFVGNRRQPSWLVGLAMIGAPMTGVTFISVPGSVLASSFSYLQMVLGFVVGSVIIAYVLIPLYYKHNVTSLYEYLDHRFGITSHKAGAWLFFVSKMVMAALRVFVVCVVVQQLLCSTLGVPFSITALIFMLLVWLYTRRGGVRSVVWSDALKTLCMVACIALSLIFIVRAIDTSKEGLLTWISSSGLTKTLFLDDVNDSRHFVKMFFAGIFMIIAMTGLDQDMMQRALSSRSQRSAQHNIVLASLLQGIVISLLLTLGVLLYLYIEQNGGLTVKADEVFAFVATHEGMPAILSVLLVLGVIASTFSSTGGSLTSLTTSFTVDILGGRQNISEVRLTKVRRVVHIGCAMLLLALVLVFERWSNGSTIDLLYRLASYTYGPLLGMFAFGILSKRYVCDRCVPAVVIAAPVACGILDIFSQEWFGGYKFGFELVVLNASLTMLGMALFSRKAHEKSTL